MKRLIIALGLVLSVVTFANAQGPQGGRQMPTPAERAERQVKQMEKLNLTADQKAKLSEIYLASAKEMDSMRASMQGQDMKEMRAKFGPMQAETNKKVAAVLTEEQRVSYKAMMDARKDQPRPEGGPKKKN